MTRALMAIGFVAMVIGFLAIGGYLREWFDRAIMPLLSVSC